MLAFHHHGLAVWVPDLRSRTRPLFLTPPTPRSPLDVPTLQRLPLPSVADIHQQLREHYAADTRIGVTIYKYDDNFMSVA